MHRIGTFTLIILASLIVSAAVPAGAVDAKKLVGTWSYEKTESNFTGRGITLKVFSEWLISFKADGTYTEQSRLQNKKLPDVSGTYTVRGDVIERSKNKVKMQILVLSDRELVITSVKNSKIFFRKK